MKKVAAFVLLLVPIASFCQIKVKGGKVPVDALFQLAEKKALKTLAYWTDSTRMPRNIEIGETQWKGEKLTGWTVGFFPGVLWQIYGQTKNPTILKSAKMYTERLEPNKTVKWTHDLGFMMHNSYGLGYKLTKSAAYKDVLLTTSLSLYSLYNPKVGTMKSWTWRKEWQHPTIMDNMLNLELLYWAGKNGGGEKLILAANTHAENTAKYHFRTDGSSYHVLNYDTNNGEVLAKITDQGFSNESTWSRGQAWAIYGFSMAFAESGNKVFYNKAVEAADYFLKNLPADTIPFWDFQAPGIPNEPKDASAAAIAASGLLKLSQISDEDDKLKTIYFKAAKKLLIALCGPKYLNQDVNYGSLLIKSTGSKPHKSEIEVSIIYADYYFLEALSKLKSAQ